MDKNYKYEEFKGRLLKGEIFSDIFYWEYLPEDIDVQQFQNWYIREGSFFEISKGIQSLLFLKVEQNSKSLCFRNSQLMALNNKTRYYEGIFYAQKFGMSYNHGFNVRKNKVIDVTYLKNKRKYDKDTKSKLYFYHGVHIPKSFIEKHPIPKDAKFSQKPLIYEYYKSLTERTNN